jgi:hypothetical protein
MEENLNDSYNWFFCLIIDNSIFNKENIIINCPNYDLKYEFYDCTNNHKILRVFSKNPFTQFSIIKLNISYINKEENCLNYNSEFTIGKKNINFIYNFVEKCNIIQQYNNKIFNLLYEEQYKCFFNLSNNLEFEDNLIEDTV